MNEPISILRASDPLARAALEALVRMIPNGPQRDHACARLQAFNRFAQHASPPPFQPS
ncbi:hypothetical protein [uncultured Variovorax sp.]|uniref:hypothetical protein n=1 Tax=uncultured Variovorax sp. TaxID=114708 RepID=UPI0026185B40|nr:hypothetical protein [uncultured Variovorax sp.]